jgi:hypothetical protein
MGRKGSLVGNAYDVYPHLFWKSGDEGIVFVGVNVFDGPNSSGKKQAAANDAWVVGDIRGTSFTGHASLCRIRDAILFGVNRGLFVTIAYNGMMFTAR